MLGGTDAYDLVHPVKATEKKLIQRLLLLSCIDNSTFKCFAVVQAMTYMRYTSLLGCTCMIFSNIKLHNINCRQSNTTSHNIMLTNDIIYFSIYYADCFPCFKLMNLPGNSCLQLQPNNAVSSRALYLRALCILLPARELLHSYIVICHQYVVSKSHC